MSRQFPRFLYSKAENVKEPGEWIVHCLFPGMICRVTPRPSDTTDKLPLSDGKWLVIVKVFDKEASPETLRDTLLQMRTWAIHSPNFPDNNKFGDG